MDMDKRYYEDMNNDMNTSILTQYLYRCIPKVKYAQPVTYH